MQLNNDNMERLQEGRGPGERSNGMIARSAGTGRLYLADPRDRNYELTEDRLRGIKMPEKRRRTVPWALGPVLDQGATNRCTVFTGADILQGAPYVHTLAWADSIYEELYRSAQKDDGIPGENYEGTTFRGVASVFKKRGLISEYLWATDEDIVREYLVTRGMLAFGSDWMTCMNTPDQHGYVEVDGTPGMMGHETTLRWYYSKRHSKYPDTYEFLNHWGSDWGQNGIFRMKADAFRYLFLQLNGDCCSIIETARKAE